MQLLTFQVKLLLFTISTFSMEQFSLKEVLLPPYSCGPSVQLFTTLCDPKNRSMPGFPGHHQLPELTQTHVHWVGDAIQSSSNKCLQVGLIIKAEWN